MAAFHGKHGCAIFTNIVFEMTGFTIDCTADTADGTVTVETTVTSATHWKDHLPGFKDWTATVECIELDCSAGLLYSGSAICTGFSPSVDKDDVGRLSLSFQGTTQLTAA
jgi:hypothetical protein